MIFPFCPFGIVAWAFHNYGPETLLAAVDAFPAQIVISNPVPMVDEKGPFQLPFFAHSWHGGDSFPAITLI
jgi:hypothetical protein